MEKVKTQEEFVKQVYDLVGDEYTILGEYKNAHTKILMRHNTCRHEYEVTPNSFLNGSRCPKCNSTPRKTQDEFVKQVYDLVGDEYTILGKYVNASSKILIRHNTCGYEYEVRPYSFLAGSRCPKCSTNKKTHEKFVKQVYDLVGDEYTVLGEYIGSDTKILMRHNTCGHEWKIKPNGFLSGGSRCPKCCVTRIQFESKRNSIFRKKVYDLVGDEYTVLGEYIRNDIKILMRHNTCGHEWKVKPNSFLNGSRCPKCAINKNYHSSVDGELFKKRVYDLVGDEYTVLGEYISSDTKILMRHNTCGHEWKVKPSAFTLYYNSIMRGEKERIGTRCPKCSHKKAKSKYLNINQ